MWQSIGLFHTARNPSLSLVDQRGDFPVKLQLSKHRYQSMTSMVFQLPLPNVYATGCTEKPTLGVRAELGQIIRSGD